MLPLLRLQNGLHGPSSSFGRGQPVGTFNSLFCYFFFTKVWIFEDFGTSESIVCFIMITVIL